MTVHMVPVKGQLVIDPSDIMLISASQHAAHFVSVSDGDKQMEPRSEDDEKPKTQYTG